MKYYATIDGESGWFPFKEGESVLTPDGTGFVVKPLKCFGPAGWTYCHVQLDGHEDEPSWIGTTSIELDDRSVRSLDE